MIRLQIKQLLVARYFVISKTLSIPNWIVFITDESFQTSPLQSNPSVTRIPAMALPLQEGPETCSRNVSFK